MPQVAIIGAGLAGLYAARLLHSAGVHCVVFEGRNRIGGRIHSVDSTGASSPDGFDVGPSWFWPEMQPAMAALVAELGLATFPQYSNGDVLFERMSREGPQRYQGYPQAPRSFRVVGGTATLVRTIADALPAGAIRPASPITSITLDADGVTLSGGLQGAEAGARGTVARAQHVVVAVPPRVFAHAVALHPAPDGADVQRWRDTPTWMAPHAKFFAFYDRAFWRDAGLSGTAQSMVGPMPEIHDATTASGQPALFGFVGVGAEQRAGMGERALTQACVNQLTRMFGPFTETSSDVIPRATLLQDWATDSFTATPADLTPSGHPIPDPRPWVSGAWADRLTMAGSETSRSEPGYLAGAVAAAQDAVHEVLARLR